MWLKFVDKDAYGNNLLHVCIELHNLDFTEIVLAQNAEVMAGLLEQRNGAGLLPSELLDKEIDQAANGVNPDKKARQLSMLTMLKQLITKAQTESSK